MVLCLFGSNVLFCHCCLPVASLPTIANEQSIYYSYLCHGALQQKEMNDWIGPTVKHAILPYMCCIFLRLVKNTTAYHLGLSSLHLLLLKSLLLDVCFLNGQKSASEYYAQTLGTEAHFSILSMVVLHWHLHLSDTKMGRVGRYCKKLE